MVVGISVGYGVGAGVFIILLLPLFEDINCAEQPNNDALFPKSSSDTIINLGTSTIILLHRNFVLSRYCVLFIIVYRLACFACLFCQIQTTTEKEVAFIEECW